MIVLCYHFEEERQLRQAAQDGDFEAVQSHLDDGVNPRATDDKGRTALHFASSKGCSQIGANCVFALVVCDSFLQVV